MKTFMKTNTRPFFTLVTACLFLIAFNGCTTDSLNTVEEEQILTTESTRASGPSVVGTGSTLIAGNLRHYAFHARTKKNGVTSGTIQFNNNDGNIRVHGSIDCLNIIDATTAVMSGVITKVNDDNPSGVAVGQELWFKVIDNGEGNNAPTDQFSNFYLITAFPCGNDSAVFMNDILNGNVQVRQ